MFVDDPELSIIYVVKQKLPDNLQDALLDGSDVNLKGELIQLDIGFSKADSSLADVTDTASVQPLGEKLKASRVHIRKPSELMLTFRFTERLVVFVAGFRKDILMDEIGDLIWPDKEL